MKYALLIFLSMHISFMQGQNQDISYGPIFNGEPFLAISPQNSQHIVVAWMLSVPFATVAIYTRVSFDGGQTWELPESIPHQITSYTSADPSLHFDSDGNVYLSYIDSNSEDAGGVHVRKSTDGGLTWGEAVEVITVADDPTQKPIDRPWMVIDNSGGPYDGNIYVTTMNPRTAGYIPPPYNPYLTKSVNGGESFEEWQHIDGEDWLAGSLVVQPMPTPTVGADGVFHAIYPSYVFSQNIYPQYILASSANGGESFTYQTVFEGTPNPIDSLAKKGYLLRADPSDAQHLAFFYPFAPFGDGDIIMRETFNAGADWTDEIRVNDDPVGNGILQDLVWADFDTDGDLVVTWRDRRAAQDTGYQVSSEIWGAVRMNGEESFGDNFPISSELVEHGPILNSSGNDFMCVEMVDDTISVVWGDRRMGILDIWFQRLTSDGDLVSISELAQSGEYSFSVFPNPCRDRINLQSGSQGSYKITNSSGKEVKSGSTQDKIVDVSTLQPGVYIIEVNMGGHEERREFVKVQ
jgi:hypothetical protein